MDLDDAILLLRDPRLGKRGMILAAKLAARELGPKVIADAGGVWVATHPRARIDAQQSGGATPGDRCAADAGRSSGVEG